MAIDEVISGLEGVLACESSICCIDGLAGKLEYRGYDIHELAGRVSFEQIAFLLWEGRLPSQTQSESFAQELADLRQPDPRAIEALRLLPTDAHPMATFRAAVGMLAAADPEQEAEGREANLQKAKRMTAQFSTLVAAQARIAAGEPLLAPQPGLSHAADYLRMLQGKEAEPEAVQALDMVLVIYAEHELNASTFTARVVTGTLSDAYSAIIGAIGALKGPLHGGAIDDVQRVLMEVGSADRVTAFLDEALAAKRKIPGFGHRVYRVLDPRAVHLQRMAERLAAAKGDTRWYDVAMEMQRQIKERKSLNANVDYYAAPVLYYLGFPLKLFTNVIASTRIVGWMAHVLEQYDNNRLIRPRARYSGEHDRRIA
ncbi:MAG TPA: citrate/2-methylcitrate synthase [Chloroflexota bacterium]